MQSKISLITIWTSNMAPMKSFYHDVMGFEILKNINDQYVEFVSDGVRFSLCMRGVMHEYSDEFKKPASGQVFELAFPCSSPDDVDRSFHDLIAKGATSIRPPHNMPWNQRTALFADPDGNIHEIFADIVAA